ncbi:DUF1285 domain-containing protein [Congregibacter variabilis]|uniref:DUF1285 domain-containing protein n=1 Tax=Congregibacter variabilis TaxID=3081200 RepID=A0ABZ0I4M4_9GAMM|nr:DUF1285 domain-containing protein [Congregibacter sp. IMCC43200]
MAKTLQGLVNTIVSSTSGLPEPGALASWSPELSGDIDIRILADGSWTHEGSLIQREGLVRVFASLLRRESDGHYYLVTPAEKWRIQVERHALVAVDCERTGENGDGVWQVLLNTGGRCRIGGEYALHGAGEHGEPFVQLPNGLSAQISRAAWYRLLDAAVIEDGRAYIISGGEEVTLGATD